ncbi:hypothetical protein V8C34DRAFT_284277 [Trichoderma compactum]
MQMQMQMQMAGTVAQVVAIPPRHFVSLFFLCLMFCIICKHSSSFLGGGFLVYFHLRANRASHHHVTQLTLPRLSTFSSKHHQLSSLNSILSRLIPTPNGTTTDHPSLLVCAHSCVMSCFTDLNGSSVPSHKSTNASLASSLSLR